MDLLVVGLDLESGLEVHAGERSVQQWHCKGHNGDQTLVCAECYASPDPRGGPRVVPLVPKGRVGGARRQHFSHPPGMAPPGGRHHPETVWHAEAKQRICRWARARGAQARVEAWTRDGRRRSDVAITLPGGQQIAIEVQLGDISDVQWLARHHDYAQAGITDVWLWNRATWVSRVMFAEGEPGWLLDLKYSKLGLIYARPGPAPGRPLACGRIHWPPCPHDPVAVYWISLESAQLTATGIQLPSSASAELSRQAAASAAPTTQRALRPKVAPTAAQDPGPRLAPALTQVPHPPARLVMETHPAFKYESRPPWTDRGTWRHWCDTCGRTLTGAELDASPIFHIIPVSGHRTSGGRVIRCLETRGGQAPPCAAES